MAVEARLISEKLKTAYPYLGNSNGMIVYFVAPEQGVCVKGNGHPFNDGDYHERWNEDNFTPLSPSESVTLRNV